MPVIERVLVKDLAAHPEGPVRVNGWVERVRDQRHVQFVILRDETGAVQLVNGAVVREAHPTGPIQTQKAARTDHIAQLTHGTFITITGELQKNERVKLGGLEIQIETLETVTAAAPENPVADDSGIDVRLDWRFLDLRRPEAQLIFRVQTTLLQAMREVWAERDFIEIQTPKMMSQPSESRAELFEVEYFERTAYLAQSPQFYKQMAQAAGFGGIFEIGPAFRADPSFTSRHATEFTSIDTEFSWINSHEDVMDLHEQLLRRALQAVQAKHGSEIEKHFKKKIDIPQTAFPRITLAQARQTLADRGYQLPRADGDLDPEAERRLCQWAKETHGHDFVFVTDYDSNIRPFYHMLHENNQALTKSYDLLYAGTEIATGAQREHRLDRLRAGATAKGLNPEELENYLDFFKHGIPPHGGFGMGLARLLMLLLGLGSIRETTYLFRGPNRLTP